jgi:hypothetical protein
MLGVNFISQYTLKGTDDTYVNLMFLTIFDLTTTWFNMIQLQAVTKLTVLNMDNGRKATYILT